MRILHIGLSEHLGGIETYLYKIARNIDLKKYEFSFLINQGEHPCYQEELQALGCRFYEIPARRDGLFGFCEAFQKLMETGNFDMVHDHLNSLSCTEPIHIALKSGVCVIAHSRNSQTICKIRSKMLHKLHYLTLPRKSITLIAVSDLAGKWMFGKHAQVIILNNGVDVDRFQFSEADRKRLRSQYGIGEERVIVHTGAFRAQKNHLFLLDIFSELHLLEPETKLIFVGDGVLAPQIKEKADLLGLQNYVIFAGERADVNEWLSAADVFLFPSLHEGFPNALLEAEAAGLPCIVSDTVTKQVRIEGLCEYVSLKKSAREWAEIVHGCKKNERRNEAGSLIRDYQLDVGSEIKRLTGVYDEIYERRSK